MVTTFKDWLLSDSREAYTDKNAKSVILSVKKTDRFRYLYAQSIYNGEDGIVRGRNFEYTGIWDTEKHILYDPGYYLKYMSDCETADTEDLLEKYRNDLRDLVKRDTIKNMGTLLAGTGRNPDPLEQESLEYHRNHDARNQAVDLFMKNMENRPVTMETLYMPACGKSEWDEEGLIRYLEDPESYIRVQADEYMRENRKQIRTALLKDQMTMQAYHELAENPGQRLTAARRVAYAMRSIPDAKSVNVTISKDGKIFKFKTEASSLRGNRTEYYWTQSIAAPDRKCFERLFGRNADYNPEDIQMITYTKKHVYDHAWDDRAYLENLPKKETEVLS